ncbi:hypothetical protein [Nocardia sp. NPDC005366]|uniref:hypothetical protein n=1 Tax=Nocardia sp. NPDC005366 TaxID=3156878 RepID=UPI0033BD29A3
MNDTDDSTAPDPAAEARRAAGRRPGKLTEADRDRIVELHAEGRGRNEIATILGVDPAAITYWARRLGIRFDQSQTAEASAARLEQLKRRRLDFAEMLEAQIPALHERLWSPVTSYERGLDTLIPVTLPLPPLRDVRDGYTALSLALRSLSELIANQSNETVASDRSMLGDLFGKLKAAVEQDHVEQAQGLDADLTAAPDEADDGAVS